MVMSGLKIRRLGMKYLCILLLLIYPILFVFADDDLVREYSSPAGYNKIFYAGDERFGYGVFYKDEINSRNAIIAVVVSTSLPKIKWHGDDIAEIYFYGGPGFFFSHIFSFKYNLLTPIVYYVIDILEDEELIISIAPEDLSTIIISGINPYKTLQKIEIVGISGQQVIYGGIKVIINADEITVLSKIEPFTSKDLKEPLYYHIKRCF
jgi:hypothetical protein